MSSDTPNAGLATCPYAPLLAGRKFQCQRDYGHAGPHYFINEAPDFDFVQCELAVKSAEVARLTARAERAEGFAQPYHDEAIALRAEVERLKQITFCCGDDKKCSGDSCACHALRQRVEELENAIKSVLQWQDLGGDLGVDLTEMLVKTLERK